MAANYIQPGNTITAIAPSGGMVSGTCYKLGAKVVVALGSGTQNAEVECAWVGVYQVPKAASLAIAQGDILYWDDTAKNFNKTSASNTEAGLAAKAAGTNDTTVWIRLKG